MKMIKQFFFFQVKEDGENLNTEINTIGQTLDEKSEQLTQNENKNKR